MSLEATVAPLADKESDDAEFDINIDPTLLQEDFYHDSSKQALCEQLVTPLVRLKENQKVTPEITYQQLNIDKVVGSLNSSHYLMNLKHNVTGRPADAHCYLCLLFQKKLKTRFGCVQCQKVFHPQCFTAFHFRHALTHNKCVMIDLAIKGVENVKGINKKCKHVGNLQDMEYPFERET
jgi:hypothetical protein